MSDEQAAREKRMREMNEALLASSVRQHELTDIAERESTARRESEEKMALELSATLALQRISTRMIHEWDAGELNEQILDAAVVIMRSTMASLQVLDEVEGALRLVAFRGFEPSFGRAFALVGPQARSSCGMAMRVGHRVVIPDVEQSESLRGTDELVWLRCHHVRAVQSTPLLARSGKLVGAISTHWREPHEPDEMVLRLMDVLARQAADLFERAEAEGRLRASELRYRTLVDQVKDYAIFSTDAAGRAATWNRGVEAILGFTEAEFVGKSAAATIFAPEDFARGAPQQDFEDAAKHGAAAYDRWMRRKDGERFFANGVTTAVRNGQGQLLGFTVVLRDQTDLEESQEQTRVLIAELNHRVKNMLAVVAALARQTIRTSPDMAAFAETFQERLKSIAEAHSLLTQSHWKGTTLEEIIGAEVAPRAGPGQLTTGPPAPPTPAVSLRPEPAMAMHMIIHELTTNAVKYGALRSEEGRLEIRWVVEKVASNGGTEAGAEGVAEAGAEGAGAGAGAGEDVLTLDWTEDCPPHQPAAENGEGAGDSGFGTRLIRQLVEYELDGQVQQDARAGGYHYRIRVPLSR